jgi:quercetin dioxygenase-like cupin family protein
MKQGKVWGETELIYKDGNFEVHRIKIKKGGYCSKHFHRFKHNMFFVEKGALRIKVWKKDYDLCDETSLIDQQKTSVCPGDLHQFVAFEDTVAFEIYYNEPIGSDIIRESVGGVK